MKTIKNGLVAAALATALTGCGAATLRNVENRFPGNATVYNKNCLDNEMEVTIDNDHYTMRCDQEQGKRAFIHTEEFGDALILDVIAFWDDNHDGNLDYLHYLLAGESGIMEFVDEQDRRSMQNRYDTNLNLLRKNEVHNLWLRQRR